jgi:hypothetical protein
VSGSQIEHLWRERDPLAGSETDPVGRRATKLNSSAEAVPTPAVFDQVFHTTPRGYGIVDSECEGFIPTTAGH